MIEILALLQGLLMGPLELPVRVPEGTARVEAWLDGEILASREEPPWILEIPFPEVPSPALLELVALGPLDNVLARESRRVNLGVEGCSPPVGLTAQEVTPVVIDVSQSVKDQEPTRLRNVFQRRGVFRHRGKPLEILAVEQEPAEIFVVMDPDMAESFERLSLAVLARRSLLERERKLLVTDPREVLQDAIRSVAGPDAEPVSEQAGRSGIPFWKGFARFKIPGRLHILWPSGPPIGSLERETTVFQLIGAYDAEGAGPLWHLHDAAAVKTQKRLTDAVAVAGWQAASTCRPRVVLFFLSVLSAKSDAGLLSIADLGKLMVEMQVPFFVLRDNPWHQPDPKLGDVRPEPDPWGQTSWFVDQWGSAQPKLFEVFQDRVEEVVKHQRVVWLRGHYLPGDVEIHTEALDFEVQAVGGQRVGRPRHESTVTHHERTRHERRAAE